MKMTQGEIARIIGCDKSVVSRERKRGLVTRKQTDWTYRRVYDADVAQRKCEADKEAKGPGLKIGSDMALAEAIRDRIKAGCSPDVIAHELGASHPGTMPCTKTLYSYISKGVIPGVTDRDLLEKTKRKKRKKPWKTMKKAYVPRKRIDERPWEVESRVVFGHWELDLVVGGAGASAFVLLTLVERMTRFAIVIRLPDKTQASVIKAFRKIEREMTPEVFRAVFKTVTTDNGSEFLDWQSIERSAFGPQSRTAVYFADPYASWQKGTNENFNRMLRRFVPKGCDIGKLKASYIKASTDWLNNYLRKKLNYNTPKEMFERELKRAS